MPDTTARTDADTWSLIHAERAAAADLLAGLTPEQWTAPSLCGSWTVRQTAAHLVVGAEQTTGGFVKGLLATGFRFNTMMDRTARGLAERPTDELVERLRARTSTTNRAPAPVVTMLGEVVVHTEDIRRPLGLAGGPSPEAVGACLEMYKGAAFPLGCKKRIEGLRLVASDLDWAHGDGPEVTGPATTLMMAITGRGAVATDLDGEGLPTLQARLGR